MDQLHKRFSNEQIKVLFRGYCQGLLSRAELQDMLEIGKTRFFVLLKQYREDPDGFTVSYDRATAARLSATAEAEIRKALLQEKALVDDKQLPISCYNYSALRDRLARTGVKVSVTTIINRAKQLDCYKPHKKRKTHDREVLTASIGALVQHDASRHLWSHTLRRSGLSLPASMTSAASCYSPTSSRRKPPGLTSRPARPSWRPMYTRALLRGLAAHISLRSGQRQHLAQTCPSNR